MTKRRILSKPMIQHKRTLSHFNDTETQPAMPDQKAMAQECYEQAKEAGFKEGFHQGQEAGMKEGMIKGAEEAKKRVYEQYEQQAKKIHDDVETTLHYFMDLLTETHVEFNEAVRLKAIEIINLLLSDHIDSNKWLTATVDTLLKQISDDEHAVLEINERSHEKLKTEPMFYDRLTALEKVTIKTNNHIKAGALLTLDSGEYNAELKTQIKRLESWLSEDRSLRTDQAV
ncbi:MAG: hypothetical protein ACO2ZM_08980 [Francisellaceae bacterium]